MNPSPVPWGLRRNGSSAPKPPIAQDKIEQRQDGLVRIILKKPYADGTVAVDLDPLSLVTRLAASVPPPRHHTVRYSGVPQGEAARCWGQRASGDRASRPLWSQTLPSPSCAPRRSADAAIGRGHNSSRARSITPRTTAHASEATDPVRVTHPFHPLRGQEIDVVAQRAQWGEVRVFYRDPRGHCASMPAAWTSLDEPDPHIRIAGGRSRFRVQDLIELATLLRGAER